MEPEVQAAWIIAAGTVLGAMIAATAAALVGKIILNREKLAENLEYAKNDIAFLLKVEELHCELHKNSGGNSNKNTVRERVRSNTDLIWSAKFTPGRIRSDGGLPAAGADWPNGPALSESRK